MQNLKVLGVENSERASEGKFRAVVMIDSELYQVGEDTEFSQAITYVSKRFLGDPMQIYNDKGVPQIFRRVVLKRDVRCLKKINTSSVLLTRADHHWLDQGTEVILGDPKIMSYDNKEFQVVEVFGLDSERFIILSELDENSSEHRFTERIDGPPIARAHTFLALVLEKAGGSLSVERKSRIRSHFLTRLEALITELKEEGNDWEEEWPK